MPLEQFFARLAESVASGSRSTVLRPLLYLEALLVAATLTSFSTFLHVDSRIQFGLAAAAALVLLVTIGAYIYFMFKAPDCLRSETFTLQKMAIEKSVVGDSLQGIVKVRIDQQLAEPVSPTAIGREERP